MKQHLKQIPMIVLMLQLFVQMISSNFNPNAEQKWNMYYLPLGWSMFGFCIYSVDAMMGFADISDKISEKMNGISYFDMRY